MPRLSNSPECGVSPQKASAGGSRNLRSSQAVWWLPLLGLAFVPSQAASQVVPPAGAFGTIAGILIGILLGAALGVLVWQRLLKARRPAEVPAKVDEQAAGAPAVQKRYERELWINQFLQQAGQQRDRGALLSLVSRELSRALTVGRVAIFLPDKSSAELRLAALAHAGENLPLPKDRLPYQGITDEAFRRGEMKLETVARAGMTERITHLALPLAVAGQTSAVLLLEELRTKPEDSEELALAQRLAKAVAGPIATAQASSELERVSRAWEKIFAQTWAGLEKTFADLADPAFIHSPDYTIVRFNDAFQRRVARSASSILGQKCYDVLFHKTAPCHYCPYQREEHEPAAHCAETPQLGERGTLRILSVSRVNAEGQNFGAMEIVRDTSMEMRLQEQLLHSEKLASIGRLVSGVAHELNNPLTAILGHAQLLERRAEDSRVKEKVKMILEEAGRASKIVRNLLTFARKQRTEQQLTDLNEIIRKTLALREYELKTKRIQPVLHLAQHLPAVVGDFPQLQQVLLNLISNAEQAMLDAHGEGTLTIESSYEEGQVCVRVRDTGPGIPPDVRQRIFDPFFTTKPIGKGTGLGLSICFGILTEHKGNLAVESNPGQGATFVVTLPVAGERAEELAAEVPTQPFLLPRKKILICSDDGALCDSLEDILKPAGALVEIEASSEQGLAKCLSGGYDLVFADWSLPGEDRLVDWLREDRPQLATRCVLLTDSAQRKEVQEFCEQTGAVWLQKPVMFAELRIALEKVLRQTSTVSEERPSS